MSHKPKRQISAAMMCAVLLLGGQLPLVAQAAPWAMNRMVLPKDVNALVSIGAPALVAPYHYLGVSLEMSGLCQLLKTDTQDRTRFENLFRNLGSVVLKVAGKSSDFAVLKPNSHAACSTQGTILTSAEVRSFFAFANRANLQVMWGLPLARYSPKAAAVEAKYIASIADKRLIGWTIGNEPDLYVRSHYRPPKWTFKDFYAQWKKTRDAVVKAVPKIGVIGPEQCCVTSYYDKFASAARGELSAISYHVYAGSRTNLTASYLLSPLAYSKVVNRTKSYWHTDSRGARVPLWVTEANTFPDGGVPGVSNAFVASLWLADLLLNAATLHVSQVDVQEVDGSNIYDPINAVGQPRPIYYGMLLYHNMVPEDAHLLSTKLTTSMNLTAYSDRTPSGALSVVLINKSAKAANIQVVADRNYRTARLYRLEAPGLTAQTDITLGGHAVSADGTWSSPQTSPLALHSRTVTVKVNAGSVACISFMASASS